MFVRNILKTVSHHTKLSSAFFVKSAALESVDKKVADGLWKLGKVNHIAIAVPNIEKAAHFYNKVLGATVSEKHSQPEHGVYTMFVELGDTKIELLQPLGDKSSIQSFINKNKDGGLHHICLEVSDIKKAIEQVRNKNIRTIGKDTKIGAHGKPVIFLHPKDCYGTLVELEEV